MSTGLDAEQIEMWEYWTPEVKDQTPMEMVQEFAKVMGQEPKPSLYSTLIQEEFDEWFDARQSMDHAHELKELSDLVYVIFGYANAKSWNLMEAICRVHANNMSRCMQPDGSVKRREDGKIVKNKDYPNVDLTDLV